MQLIDCFGPDDPEFFQLLDLEAEEFEREEAFCGSEDHSN